MEGSDDHPKVVTHRVRSAAVYVGRAKPAPVVLDSPACPTPPNGGPRVPGVRPVYPLRLDSRAGRPLAKITRHVIFYTNIIRARLTRRLPRWEVEIMAALDLGPVPPTPGRRKP